MSPMIFFAPNHNPEANRYFLIIALILFYTPCFVFLIYYFLGYSFFGANAKKLALSLGTIITLILFISGYFKIAHNTYRGIRNTDYSITKKHIYYSGEIINKADVESFHLNFKDSKVKDLRIGFDKNNVYFLKRISKDNPKAFSIVKMANIKNFRVTSYDNESGSDTNDGLNYYLEGQLVNKKD